MGSRNSASGWSGATGALRAFARRLAAMPRRKLAALLIPLAILVLAAALVVRLVYPELRVLWVLYVFPPRWEPSSDIAMDWIPSPYYHRRLSRVDTLVIHTTEGSLESTINWFRRNPEEVSAHYGISRDGRIVQFVNERFAAHHAGIVSAPEDTRWHRGNPNEYSIGIELESTSPIQKASDLPPAQREALWLLAKDIVRRHGIPVDRQHVVGHAEIDPANRDDPGPGFPWDEFLTYLGD